MATLVPRGSLTLEEKLGRCASELATLRLEDVAWGTVRVSGGRSLWVWETHCRAPYGNPHRYLLLAETGQLVCHTGSDRNGDLTFAILDPSDAQLLGERVLAYFRRALEEYGLRPTGW